MPTPKTVRDVPAHAAGIVLSLLFLIVVHVHIANVGAPLVTPTAYLLWLGMACVILLAFLQAQQHAVYVSPRLTRYLFLFVALLLATTLVNPVQNYHDFIFRTAGLVAGAIYFIAMHQFRFSEATWEKLLIVVFVSGAFEAGLGLMQFFSLSLQVPYLLTAASVGMGGNFQQANLLASYLATALVISLYVLAGPIFETFGRGVRAGFYALTMFVSLTLFLSGSRTGAIGAALGVFVLLVARFRHYRGMRRLLPWFLALAIGLGGSLVAAQVHPGLGVGKTAQKMGALFDGPLGEEGRFSVYYVTYEMFRDKPVFGQGRGSFAGRYVFHQRELLKTSPGLPVPANFVTHPHNEALHILAESGLVGMAGLLIVAAAIIVVLFRLGRERGGVHAALLLPLALHTQTELPFYQSVGHWMLFLTLLVPPSSHFVREQPVRLAGWGRAALTAAAAAAFVFAVWFLVGTLRAHVALTRYVVAGASPLSALPAMGNAYLGQTAERVLAIETVRAIVIPREARILGESRAEQTPALAAGEKQLLEDFTAYARNERRIAPLPALYAWEARALYALGSEDQARRLLDEGLSLYPGEPAILKQARLRLVAQDLKRRLTAPPPPGR